MSKGKRKVVYDDDDSQKENEDLSAQQSSKTKTVASTRTRASGRVNLQSQNVVNGDDQTEETLRAGEEENHEQNDENENENEEGEEEDEAGSPNGRKRARLNANGDSVAVKNEKIKVQRTLARDTDGYVPGSIVRIQLKNFVTYDFVEFRPGSSLNMIFGPNGTGKSTIACAICIGLGGAPSLLGRATDLNSFVKHGCDTGYVELELKGKIGSKNLIIRRSINNKSRSSQFTLNGASTTGREINDRLAELNVQVGNLCSFLPQDRVSEFAQMTPQQLLKETQRTAGHASLTAWHNVLIEKGKELLTSTKTLKDDTDRLTSLEEKQKVLEKDVKRYNERREIEKQIEVLNIVLPYVEYRESKAKFEHLKAQFDVIKRKLKEAEAKNKPLKDFHDELKEENDALEKKIVAMKQKRNEKYVQRMSSCKQRSKAATTRADDAIERIKYIKRQEKDRVKNIAKAKEEIQKYQEKVDNPPEYEDVKPILDSLRTISTEAANVKSKRLQIDRDVKVLVNQTAQNKHDLDRKDTELKGLENYTNAKVRSLEGWDRDCADVVKWILANKSTNEFAARVDLPAFIGLSIKDQRFTSAVEACFNGNQMKTFIVHDENDYRQFNRLFTDTPNGIGRKARVTVWYRPRNEATLIPPPLFPQEMEGLGFEGYAIDFIECSEGLRWYCMKELNMHRTPIALRSVNDSRTQELLSRAGPDGRSAGGTYISGTTIASVSRSAYGQRKVMTVTRGLPPARNFVHPSVDPEVKRKLERDMAELRAAIEELQARSAALAEEDKVCVEELQKYKPEHDKLVARQQAVDKAMGEIKTNETRLGAFKKKLIELERQPSADEEHRTQKAIVEQTVRDRTEVVREVNALVQEMIQDSKMMAITSLRKMKVSTDFEAIVETMQQRDESLKKQRQVYDEARKVSNEARDDASTKAATAREKFGSLDDEMRERFKELETENQAQPPEEQWTTEKVLATLEMEQTKLELNHATDAGVIATYEAREREINSLREEHEKRLKSHKRVEEKIQATRDLWYPALADLITAVGEKFSAAFDRIGCAGELRISEHEEYDKWSIDIFVKFRNEEPLTQLTGQRQSGGERSLTTIMYLMSLTEHARAPFSLVDEINQGMDQRYERAVHDQLVKVTCQPDSGQYFLITPKLLPFLSYHENMKILCVNNGEWLPEATSSGVGNMKQMIERVTQRRAHPAAS